MFLSTLRPELVPDGCDAQQLLWAHDMYLSRRFPDMTTPDIVNETTPAPKPASANEQQQQQQQHQTPPKCSELTRRIGLMMPLMDLFNHRFGISSGHRNEDGSILFHLGATSSATQPAGVKRGGEIFFNYGADKGSESMMMAYGFCIQDNHNDSYGLKLTARLPPQFVPKNLGTFRLLRPDNPDVLSGKAHQIPIPLWQAIRYNTNKIDMSFDGVAAVIVRKFNTNRIAPASFCHYLPFCFFCAICRCFLSCALALLQ